MNRKPSNSKLTRNFGDRSYLHFDAFIAHMREISQAINNRPKIVKPKKGGFKRGLKALTPFDLQLAEIAPRHKTLAGGRYNSRTIAIEILGHEKAAALPRMQRRQLMYRIYKRLQKLKKRGIIQASTSLKAVKLQEATKEEIAKHTGLVHYLLKRGHPFLRKDWRRYLKYKEAVGHGKEGLMQAIERFDKTRGIKFGSYAAAYIVGAVSTAAKIAKGRELPLEPIHEERVAQTKYADEKESNENTELLKLQLETLFKLHKERKLRSHQAAIYGLRLIGHTHKEIGTELNTNKQRIHQIEEQTKVKLREAMRE